MGHILLLTEQSAYERAKRLSALLASAFPDREVGVVPASAAEPLDRRERLGEVSLVVADSATPLTAAQSTALAKFTRDGGALLLLGETVDAWRDSELGAALGLPEGQRGPATELVVRLAGEHDITQRLDPSFAAVDRLYIHDGLPGDAMPLLTTSWRFSTIPVAWLRPVGAGAVAVVTLGAIDGALERPTLWQALFRAARYLTGWREPAPARIAMIGYGAIGYEHASAIAATRGLELALVCDRNPARLDAARERFPSLRVASEIDEVIEDDAVDAAIVGAPPNIHASLALRLLRAGKSVIVEKPFSITTAEADEMIAEAETRDLTLTCYQNRRWDPDFLAIQRAVEEGRIGDLFHLEMFIGGFAHPCDYWHSHEPVSGGVFYDWGSHYLDWALTLLPDQVADVRASSHKRVWRDVTNADQASIAIRFRDGREVSFIHSDIAAALKPKWYALGTRGAITGHWRHETVTARKWNGDLIEERLAPSEALPAVTLATRDAAGLIHEERLPLPPAPERPFHRNLADHLLAGEPLAINPRASRRNIAVMEAAAWSAAHDSAVVPIDERYA
ncbi:MAG TPA: Gfo/Idh/MocA family oxidoreductase [Ktedonobacterales bacterium]|nr:Gfo/Idh/MocA family oxidoreductase [Ktedonobacterales bacterium]